MKRIGFLINPIAGVGGAVGLKGTDDKVEEALLRGAEPLAKNRAKITLNFLKKRKDMIFFTPAGAMGEEALKETGVYNVQIVSHPANKTTVKLDNFRGVVFVGGFSYADVHDSA